MWAKENNHTKGKTLRFLIDPFGGMQDVEKGVLRCVGNPEARFQEDALRILRGVRLVNIINQKLTE
ncbi:hypothetical protein KBC03_06380 [Patescibacteria group bacterium]|nr:hypothetical protein [Patescibacteria group bacterium]